ncbi:transcription initiation factor TFIID subunit 4 isoform X2 [Cherax quadricarinatus]|uniref:transcription initiation factor TFIID subunit 4 isoform X2 n=1 Tax=Cherax quadricarinatus TaxID=27406 RepID=UPI002378897D|nr:transcription initiation factor TFIID subunit 4-like isoform X2 [Cherax quadricarinatus]
MATSKSLDQVLCTDSDHSPLAATVGSLHTHLAASPKTAANEPANASVNGGINNKATVVGEGRSNCGKIELRGPAVNSGAVFAGKVVSGVGCGQGVGQVVEITGGALVVHGEAGVGAAIHGGAQLSSSSSKGAAAALKPVYGVALTPMTGAQGTQVVNGGVTGAGTGGAPQVSLQAQLALKALSKVVTAAATAGQTAVIMSKPGTVTAVPSTATPGTVPIPQGMQIINMRPGQAIKTTQGATIAPRMILNQAQVLPAGMRAGQPGVSAPLTCQSTSPTTLYTPTHPCQQITLGPLQGLPPGAQGHLLVKTENGQLQLLRVNTAAATPGQLPTNVTTTTALQQAPNTAYRFQPPQAGTVAVRSVMVSSAAARPATIILQSQASNTAALSTVTTTTTVASQGVTAATNTTMGVTPGTTVTGTMVASTLTTATPTTQASQPATVGSQTISAESAKTKCKNFLATLLKLANEQRAPVARNVRNLIQGLIDGRVEPEAFTEELQKDLNSSPQPCLVPFLKKTLPYLRLSLARQELTIDGVRPPPISAVTPVPGVTTVIPAMPVSRPVAPTTSGTVRMVAPTSVSSANLVQRPVNATPAPTRVVTQQVQQVRVQGGKTVVTTVRQNTAAATATTSTANATTNSVPTATKTITVNKALPTKDKDKTKDKLYTYSGAADDDINDVAAMGGVNLGEESQRILDSTGFVGTQIRSCKDENFLLSSPLTERIRQICSKHGLDDAPKDVVALVSHATQERLKTIVEKLAVISDHRLDIIKTDSRYEVRQDVKGQLRFLEELDKMEKKRKDERERDMLMRAAKSRSKSEDPEQAKLKAKAKEMQRVEMEEMRQRDANRTALNALQGPKKKPKLDLSMVDDGATFSGTFTQKSMPLRPRIKRVNMRDLMFLMEQEKELNKSPLLYRSYLK